MFGPNTDLELSLRQAGLSKEEYFCNRCGQPIDYWEYNNSVKGYCEDCLEEEELENE